MPFKSIKTPAEINGGDDGYKYFEMGHYKVIDNKDGSITIQVWQFEDNIKERDYTIPMR